MTNYRWIFCGSLLNRITNKDRLFQGDYTLDPYQKCDLGCRYCDASEDTVYIKSNAAKLLKEEIKEIKRGTVIVGSTVDPYQMVEKKQRITRELLRILTDHGLPFHVLTKSGLILRDLPLISESKNARITISLSTINKKITKVLEPFAASPEKRFNVVKKLSEEGIQAGVAIMPVLPVITDEDLETIIEEAKNAGAKHIIYATLQLKGEQKKRFFSTLETHFPEYLREYKRFYSRGYFPSNYTIGDKIRFYCDKYKIKKVFGSDL
ncbi:MAG TPA: radical SAM protein [Thermoplasmatales archaeon]|nr:radical SAM protein [Thermoplasmatales archaeon]